MEAEAPQVEPQEPISILEVGILSVKPGDVIVLRIKSYDRRAMGTSGAMKEFCDRNFPGHEVMVLLGDIDIGIMRKESDNGSEERACGTEQG